MKKIVVIALIALMAFSSVAVLAAQTTPGFEWMSLTARKDDTDGLLPKVDPKLIKGNIVTAGSSTVYPLAEAIGARLRRDGYAAANGTLTIDSIGSGAGRERFVKGEIMVANASSPIKSSEVDIAKTNNINPLEFKVGVDALAVVINKSNSFARDADKATMQKIFTAEFWSDVNPAWPKQKIIRFIPGTDSGTFEFFVEAVFDKKKDALLAAPNTQKSEDDNVLVRGVEGNPFAVGFFGYAYYNEERSRLSIMNYAGVEPTTSNVLAGKYGLSRPLFLYSDANIMRRNPQAAAYINYFLTFVNQEIRKVGYFPLPPEELRAAKQKWVDAMKAAGVIK